MLALIIVLILAIAAISGFLAGTSATGPETSDIRMPAGRPLLEPDRPDLRGEPGIAKEEAQADDPEK